MILAHSTSPRAVGDHGELIRDTTIAEVEATADRHGRPVVTAAGFHACVIATEGRVLILRAPVEAVA